LTQAIERAGGKADIGPDPITLMKAKKNAFELAGARSAHERDGAAMATFLSWFATEAPRGRLTEIEAVKALETFRRASPGLKDLSFPTIAGAGPNSAIPHYRVSEASNRKIERGIFLIDSGAQYEDGTTDITRTIAVGRPSPLMRDRFTRVLKGHIAVARAIFPPGTNGAQIDALARGALWRAGLDFDHGTGHGIGSYLSVHEGPQRIAKTGTTALAPGMIISNEPGYYAAGAFGIRIENLLVVEMRTIAGGERPMLGFETLTFAPIDLSLVEPKLMDADEIAWLDDYHARVRKTLSPRVDSATRAWLTKATRRLAVVKARRG
jgi:Xaa-Pro aminopeptidase